MNLCSAMPLFPDPRPAPATASAYDSFALVYSQTMAEDFCRRAFPVIKRQLLNGLRPASRILDVCCGAGQMAREMSALGFAVYGIDASEEMIQLARKNAPAAHFTVADARNFTVSPQCDAAISTFNSFAHASGADELAQIFRCVKFALQPGAQFLFDLTMHEGYKSLWHGSISSAEADFCWILRPDYDEATKIARNDVTVFRPVSAVSEDVRQLAQNDHWLRSDFTILQKCHSQDEIEGALHAADFVEISTFDAERDLGLSGESGRSFFLAR